MVEWNLIYEPKHKGGLGIKPATLVNAGYMAKLVWHFLSNPDSLWAKVLCFKHVKDNSSNTSLSRSHNLSLLWQGLFSVADDTKCDIGWSMGSGKTMKFWSDSWLDVESPLLNFVSFDTPMDIEDVVVAYMIH